MNKTIRSAMVIILGILFAGFPAFGADMQFSGFLGNPGVYDLLKPGPDGGVKLRWQKEGISPRKYNKFMVDSVIFFLADKSDYKGIDPQDMKNMADHFNKEIVMAFKDKYPIVSEPGPDVARIRIAITNVQPSRPGVSFVTSVVPIGLGVSLIKKGVTGGWAGSGETGMEVIVLDSTTNEAVFLAADTQKAAFESRFSKWGSATDAFKFWADKAVQYIDADKGVKREHGK